MRAKLMAIAILLTAMNAQAGEYEPLIREAANKAAIKTDLYFACSEKGRQELSDLATDLYEFMFDCQSNIEKALAAGLTEAEIQQAIER